MGAEAPKEWDQEDVKQWIKTALASLKSYYLRFQGTQWHEYETSAEDLSLLLVKICYSMYGPPTSAKDTNVNLQDAYDSEQKAGASKIKDKILETYRNSSAKALRVGIIFVACKQDANEFVLPIFRVSSHLVGGLSL